ncbi:DNA-binding bromodomain-containing protein [Striga hermonthica]|uniref:DNA-binding bromodomain-containing protein n=1 Tax=Striga hermonthica TaxID=68872 RepID=A0A9N7RGV3_STRHE|nr:DNA-binding bromodomain-containing protein [Striga hermonthica]
MGKVSSAKEMKRRKKKGRPPKNSLSLSAPQRNVNRDSTLATNCRSNRRNPNHLNSSPPEFVGDDDDERKEKKVKFVGRLPESGESKKINQKNKRHSGDNDSVEDQKGCAKRRNINAVDRGSDGATAIQEKKPLKATDTLVHGSPLESGPTTSLPDRMLLVYILDRLQKKDTYGVFSEPVDIDELPDYYEVIEQPMDFGTVRKKLDSGAYKNLEQLEADVFLIVSNAMLYNAEDTVYYRQARSIEEIAKRDFGNLRHEGDNGEPQPMVVRRGRPPSIKNQKKLLETFSQAGRVSPKMSSGDAVLRRGEDSSYNLRKAPVVNRFRNSDMFVPSYRSRNGNNYAEWLADWNDEFPASILRADMKCGKKQFTVDENRRETYGQFHALSSAENSSAYYNPIGDVKRLIPVGPHDPLSYAQSLARFAANLGPVAQQVAARKMETAFPGGAQSLGWVSESGPQLLLSEKLKDDCNSSIKPLNSAYMKTTFPVQQKPVYYHQPQPQRNGLGGMFGYNTSTVGMGGPFRLPDEGKQLWGNLNISSAGYQITQGDKLNLQGVEDDTWSFRKSTWPAHQGLTNSNSNIMLGPPDLNVGISAASPSSSSLQFGLPDLALQL